MGTQTMGSNGSSGGGGGASQMKPDGLARQGSLYSLTLDEVQHQLGDLGKPLTSMNLDELLKSVWTAEANQGVGNGPPDYSQLGSASSLPRQSSLNLSRDLSKKTVDEVWQDIQRGQKKKKNAGSSNNNNNNNSNNNSNSNSYPDRNTSRERQLTLGEMTLEDFLVKAGVVAESSPGKKNPASLVGVDATVLSQQSMNPQQAQWMQYQIPPIPQQHVFISGHHPVQQSLPINANPIMDVAYPETQITMSPSPLMGTLSDTQTPGRKRVASGDVMEKTVERRQKRMIKNRESAARSRARKQAYTHELENKVSRLEEENERLKRQKEVEKLLPCVPPPEPKYQLRRTSSAPF